MLPMKTLTAIVILAIVVVLGWLLLRHHAQAPVQQASNASVPSAVAHYACDKGKFIDAAFFDGTTTPAVQPGQPPQPTGTAAVSIDGGATTTLRQTVSADGARYASADESFVFWSKGNQALIMRDNSMDLAYTNCTKS